MSYDDMEKIMKLVGEDWVCPCGSDPDPSIKDMTYEELYGLDPKAVNTITDYEEWVKEVRNLLLYHYFMSEDSKLAEPYSYWREMFDKNIHPNYAAFYLRFPH